MYADVDQDTTVKPKDASPRERVVLWPSNWKVCSQSPQAGTRITADDTIAVNVVKFEETCP